MGRLAVRSTQVPRARTLLLSCDVRPHSRAAPSHTRPFTTSTARSDEDHKLPWRSHKTRLLDRSKTTVTADATGKPRGDHEDPRDAVRLNWHALDFQTKRTLDGSKAMKFGVRGLEKRTELQWPSHERDEDEEVQSARPVPRAPRARRARRTTAKEETESASNAETEEHTVTLLEEMDEVADKTEDMDLGDTGPRFPGLFGTPPALEKAPYISRNTETVFQSPSYESTSANPSTPSTPSAAPTSAVQRNSLGHVVVKAVSTNVRSSDFARLDQSDFSAWSQKIEHIQQVRHGHTLEPLNSFEITFSDSAAAEGYTRNLTRLQRLNHFKYLHAPGNPNWKDDLPADLKGSRDPDRELALYNILPGHEPSIDVRVFAGRRRKYAWLRRLEDRLGLTDEQERPPLVIADLYPPSGYNFSLQRAIQADAVVENWDLEPPISLEEALEEELGIRPAKKEATKKQDMSEEQLEAEEAPEMPEGESVGPQEYDFFSEGDQVKEKIWKEGMLPKALRYRIRGRYLIVCSTDDEARRFHRKFNNKTVWGKGTGVQWGQDTVIHTTIMEW